MKTNKKKLGRRLLGRYILRMAIMLAAFGVLCILLVALAVYIADNTIWRYTDFWYPLASFIGRYFDRIVLLGVAAGVLLILFWNIWRMTRDMAALATTIEQIALHSTQPIDLPGPLSDVELLLQKVQLEAQQNDERAREAEQRKNDLVVYLAHDLKTPLTSVLGYLSLLHDEPDISPALQHRYLGVATAKAQKLEDLINEFFEITRFNLKGLTLEATQLNLSRMIEQLNDEFRPLYARKNLRAELDVQPGVELVADAGKLERVIDNLLRNAVNYSYPDTGIHITLREKADGALLCVQNEGDTIPQHKLARIFEQFYRLDSSRGGEEGGSGLGLAIAKEIVERHGGSIGVESVQNTITFTVRLPHAAGDSSPALPTGTP